MSEHPKIKETDIIPEAQFARVKSLMRGEEGKFFKTTVAELLATADAMPRTGETDGQGMQAKAHLHYFSGGCDWWITELDVDSDESGQYQAFGLADLGYGAELGYISLVELCACPVEIDFHWTPQTLAEIKAKRSR